MEKGVLSAAVVTHQGEFHEYVESDPTWSVQAIE